MWTLKFLMFYHYFCWFAVGEEQSSNNGTIENNQVSYIFGIRPMDCKGSEYSDGLPILYTGETSNLYVFGINLTSTTEIGFTHGENCDFPIPSEFKLSESERFQSGYKGVVTFTPVNKHSMWSVTKYYACMKDTGAGETAWRFQGTGLNISLYVAEPFDSPWLYIMILMLCYFMASLMSGLNIGLMSLDNSELQLLKKAGTPKERKYAEKIIPVRRNGNFLVCSIVITGTLCNAISTVVQESFFSNVLTVLVSTLIILLFCEILPQSICSTYPLVIGARTIYITKACMILTSPVSYPLSKLLNCIVGKELAKSYNKERLKELLKKTNLPTHEEKIITGTLDFSSKTVEEIMTVSDDIFKLPITAVMNFETIAAIISSGFSRIPIYVGDKSNIQYVLLTKDLALLDPDDKIPVKDLVQKSKSACVYVPKGMTLDEVLEMFKSESRFHMLFVTENVVSNKKEKKVIGLLTFEDIIEEIFQMEILDETDTIYDNRGKRRLSITQKTDLISLFLQPTKANAPSENVKLSTYCFLSEVEEFSGKNMSPKVLISLLNLDIFYSTSGKKLPQDTIYVRGVQVDFFVMILEGQMNVKIGAEEMVFEVGPFRYFGTEALRRKAPFTPDYTLQGVTKSLYLKIPIPLYSAALLATRFDRSREHLKIDLKSEVGKYFTQIMASDSMSSK